MIPSFLDLATLSPNMNHRGTLEVLKLDSEPNLVTLPDLGAEGSSDLHAIGGYHPVLPAGFVSACQY